MWDEESNLLYLRARYYEPETGRFLSRDKYEGELQSPLSKNLYTYVQNNPISFIDPSGNSKLRVNGQPTNVRLRNIKGGNAASLRDLADSVGAHTVYYPDSKQAAVYYKDDEGWYSQSNFYTENGRIQIAVRTFADHFGIGVSWSGRGMDQVVNLITGYPKGFVGVHEVAASNCHTCLILYIDKTSKYYNDSRFLNSGDVGIKYATIGAGPEGMDPILPGGDKLINDVNRQPNDVDLSIKVENIPLTPVTDKMIARLFELERNYTRNSESLDNSTIEYDLFPDDPGTYNSNSFTSGLLNAAGFTDVPTPDHDVPGWNNPVPEYMFLSWED